MARSNSDDEQQMDHQLLRAILALLVDERERAIAVSELPAEKTEVILARAGLTPADIAGLQGKKPDAVRKSIQRARGNPK